MNLLHTIKSLFFVLFLITGTAVMAFGQDDGPDTTAQDTTIADTADQSPSSEPDTTSPPSEDTTDVSPDTTTQGADDAAPQDTEQGSGVSETGGSGFDDEEFVSAADTMNFEDTVVLSFVKKQVVQGSDSLYVNILKVRNYYDDRSFSGVMKYSSPDGWSLIFNPMEQVDLSPSDSVMIPLRLAVDPQAFGGNTYVLNARYETDEEIYSGNAYITIPKKVDWEVRVEESSVFFTQYQPSEEFKVHLSNNGNSETVIKLEYEVGKMLNVIDENSENFVEFVKLAPRKDCTITYSVVYDQSLGTKELFRYERNWRASTVQIRATSKNEKQGQRVWFRRLESEFTNNLYDDLTPLNLRLGIYNILSPLTPNFRLGAQGDILFPKERSIRYRAFVNNLRTTYEGRPFDINQDSYFRIHYHDKKNDIILGDNIGAYRLYNIPRFGIKADHKLNEENQVGATLATSRIGYNNSAASLRYRRQLLSTLSLKSEAFYEINNTQNYEAFSLMLSPEYSFLDGHTVRVSLLGSRVGFFTDPNDPPEYNLDTTVYGMSYDVRYNYSSKKLTLFASHYNTLNNYLRNSNTIRSYLRGRYRFNDKYQLRAIYSRNNNIRNVYPLSFDQPSNEYLNEYGRLILNVNTNRKISYFAGPDYRRNSRLIYDNFSNNITEFDTYNYGLYGGARIKMGEFQYVSPNVTLGLAHNRLSDQDTSTEDLVSDYQPTYRLGLNYTGKYWMLTSYYSSGPVNMSPNFLGYYNEIPQREVLLVRPSFRKYFRNRTIQVRASLNYLFQMPSNRQSVNFNANLRFDLGKGWEVSLTSNVNVNTRHSEEFGTNKNRSFNLFAGIQKSFDIPQPRIKYYDLDVVCYEDLNNNGEMDEDDPPVANIKMGIKFNQAKADSLSTAKINFKEKDLISSPKGEMRYENIPEGNYDLDFTPLTDIGGLYIVNGREQNIEVNEDKTLYIRLVESYKVKGKLVFERGEYSQEGEIDKGDVRVTAVREKDGHKVSSLTDASGRYQLSIPGTGTYKISVNNVYGERFTLENKEYRIQFNGVKSVNLDFKFIEEEREIEFDNGGGEETGQVGTDETNDQTADEGRAENEGAVDPASLEGGGEEDSGQSMAEELESQQDEASTDQTADEAEGTSTSVEDTFQEEEGGQEAATETADVGSESASEESADEPSSEELADMGEYNDLDSLINQLVEKTEEEGGVDEEKDADLIQKVLEANENTPMARALKEEIPEGEIERPVDKDQVKFKVQVGLYRGDEQIPVKTVNKYLELDYSEVERNDKGTRYTTTREFSDYKEAFKYQKELLDEGFNKTLLVGSYKGETISAKRAFDLLKE